METDELLLHPTDREAAYCPLYLPQKGEYGQWPKINRAELADRMNLLVNNYDHFRSIANTRLPHYHGFTWLKAGNIAAESLAAHF